MSRVSATPDSTPLDSVPIGADSGGSGSAVGGGPKLRVADFQLLAILFMIFMFVSSDVFINNVISGMGKSAVRGRTPTTWGVVLQGIFLVLFYIVAIYLTTHGVL